MSRSRLSEPLADPFGERRGTRFTVSAQLLGAHFQFETDSAKLLRIVRWAYGALPPHQLAGRAPRLRVRLVLTAARRGRIARHARAEPAMVQALATPGLLCGASEGASLVAISPAERTALVVIPQDLLRFPYNVRYELLEFAVYTLAARVQGLVPLHAACVGRDKRGVLLVGPSGSGKSTLTLHCLRSGFEFLAEDSVLVQPQTLLATGVASFLHLRADSLRFLDARAARSMRNSPVIRRRSGIAKFEVDLRRPHYRLAQAPLRIVATVLLSAAGRGGRCQSTQLSRRALAARLTEEQPYAVAQAGWGRFSDQISRLPAIELRRGAHPQEAVDVLEGLLQRVRG